MCFTDERANGCLENIDALEYPFKVKLLSVKMPYEVQNRPKRGAFF